MFRNRLVQSSLGLLTILTVLGCLFPDRTREMGLDFWNLAEDQDDLLQARARASQLDTDGHKTTTRLLMKSRIVKELIAGSRTLPETVDQFIALNRSGEDITESVRNNFPAPTLEESTHLHLMMFVDTQLKEASPEIQIAVRERLARESLAIQQTR